MVLIDPKDPPPRNLRERLQRVIDGASGVRTETDVSSWEWDRLHEWRGQTSLSAKQEAVVQRVEAKVFGTDPDNS